MDVELNAAGDRRLGRWVAVRSGRKAHGHAGDEIVEGYKTITRSLEKRRSVTRTH